VNSEKMLWPSVFYFAQIYKKTDTQSSLTKVTFLFARTSAKKAKNGLFKDFLFAHAKKHPLFLMHISKLYP